MKAVSLRTGLSPHVLRVWEKRYGAVRPRRTDTNRRLYTEEEVVRLGHLAYLTRAGHSISQIASLPSEQLESMCGSEVTRRSAGPAATPAPADAGAQGWIQAGMQAVRESDQTKLETVFDEAGTGLGYSGLLEHVVVPLIQLTGEEWEAGTITAAQEHIASSLIRDYLARSIRPFSPSANAPHLLVTTPVGQIHELGAIVSAAMGRKLGWNVTYLGAALPAQEIAGAAIKNKSRAVALSIVYPPDDPDLPSELHELRRLLPEETVVLVGGRAVHGYSQTLSEIDARILQNFDQFKSELEILRKSRLYLGGETKNDPEHASPTSARSVTPQTDTK